MRTRNVKLDLLDVVDPVQTGVVTKVEELDFELIVDTQRPLRRRPGEPLSDVDYIVIRLPRGRSTLEDDSVALAHQRTRYVEVLHSCKRFRVA